MKDNATLQDNVFIDAQTLQIVEEAQAAGSEPMVYKREKSCQLAESRARERLAKMYPKVAQIKAQVSVKQKLFVGWGGCKVILHIVAPALQKSV